MQKKLILSLFVFCRLTFTYAQSGDAILGIWLNEKKDGKIEVYKEEDQYFGKILWLKDDRNDDKTVPKLDLQNPDPELRDRPLVGLTIIRNLEWDAEEQEWNEGEIYDPRGGSTYSMFARLEDPDTLYLKGYIGFSLIGRSTEWTRIQ